MRRTVEIVWKYFKSYEPVVQITYSCIRRTAVPLWRHFRSCRHVARFGLSSVCRSIILVQKFSGNTRTPLLPYDFSCGVLRWCTCAGRHASRLSGMLNLSLIDFLRTGTFCTADWHVCWCSLARALVLTGACAYFVSCRKIDLCMHPDRSLTSQFTWICKLRVSLTEH